MQHRVSGDQNSVASFFFFFKTSFARLVLLFKVEEPELPDCGVVSVPVGKLVQLDCVRLVDVCVTLRGGVLELR